ncbi:uncharacterized mitochondrial protein AtMg00300-like [Cannabis sativa]|uniref:uncharacterized mitochondrial protein AtMg00300-like n=1 Tax=Cannabis sativa TaxID=3483 RepID=UPI0029CA797A|nr:uncharacterized mitochondrial protein AtMg00300-like [Cannabis sativa]
MKCEKINGLYVLQREIVPAEEVSMVKGIELNMKLWHHRLRHISEQGLKELQKQCIIENLNSCALPFCEACVLGKQHKLKFTLTRHTTKKILKYVYTDPWGPYKVPTHSGKPGNKNTKSMEMDYGMKLSEEGPQAEDSVEPKDNA